MPMIFAASVGVALVDYLPRMGEPVGRQFRLMPEFTPRRCAAFIPARVRSTISDRSSSANTPVICHMARPVGVSVPIASVSDRKSDALAPEFVRHGDKAAQPAA
jgi:hypothetical protein